EVQLVGVGEPGSNGLNNGYVIKTKITYVHCLFDGLSQRSPLVDFIGTYVHQAGCWIRNFGGYNDGVNPQYLGRYNWPCTTGSRFAETMLPGPATGAQGITPPGTPVAGAFVFNT